MNKVNRYVYSDLLNNSNKVNAYKRPDSFKFRSESIEDQLFLKTIVVEEIELIRYSQGDSLGFEKQFYEIAVENILIPNKRVIAFITDFMLKPLSRLRSYRGILSKDLKEKSQFIEAEMIIEGQSIIGNLLTVDKENIKIIFDKYFGDSSVCCIIQSEHENIFREEILKAILENCMIHTQNSTINYFSLCKLLKGRERIIRSGGDGYDNVSIQLFSKISENFSNLNFLT